VWQVGANKKIFFNFSPQYLKLRPPVACGLEAKQLGPNLAPSFIGHFLLVLPSACFTTTTTLSL